jgi:hypothetical protein
MSKATYRAGIGSESSEVRSEGQWMEGAATEEKSLWFSMLPREFEAGW